MAETILVVLHVHRRLHLNTCEDVINCSQPISSSSTMKVATDNCEDKVVCMDKPTALYHSLPRWSFRGGRLHGGEQGGEPLAK